MRCSCGANAVQNMEENEVFFMRLGDYAKFMPNLCQQSHVVKTNEGQAVQDLFTDVDLNELIKLGLVKREGIGKSTRYKLK